MKVEQFNYDDTAKSQIVFEYVITYMAASGRFMSVTGMIRNLYSDPNWTVDHLMQYQTQFVMARWFKIVLTIPHRHDKITGHEDEIVLEVSRDTTGWEVRGINTEGFTVESWKR